ncbi:MAG TPA: TAXI family TRAP transporter solute-binding subunit [Aldersonia sp.]
MSIDRRGFLAGAGALTLAALAGCGFGADTPTVRLGAGERGGLYYAFAGLLAAAGGAIVRVEPVTTAGSRENLDLLAVGTVDAALALADSIRPDDDVRALGRVYENYLQLAVRADSPIGTVADLRGRRMNLGAVGSGAARTGERLLLVAGLDPAADVSVTHLPLQQAVAALDEGTVDAMLWAGGVPTIALMLPEGLRLVPLGELVDPMRARFGPFYDPVRVPAGAYPGVAGVATIGVPNFLLCRPGMRDATAQALVGLLLADAHALVPDEAAGTQFLDGRSLIATGDIPLHPGAVEAYRRWHG